MSRKQTKSLGHFCGLRDVKYVGNSLSTTGDAAENALCSPIKWPSLLTDRNQLKPLASHGQRERETFEVSLKFLL
jgi:hypothetical protein